MIDYCQSTIEQALKVGRWLAAAHSRTQHIFDARNPYVFPPPRAYLTKQHRSVGVCLGEERKHARCQRLVYL